MLVAAYMEKHPGSPQTIKQHLAAIKMLFDYLVISQREPDSPLFPAAIGKTGKLSRRPLVRTDAADMLKRRLKKAELPGDSHRHQSGSTTASCRSQSPRTQMALQCAQRQAPVSTELCPVRSARLKFIHQSLDFFPATSFSAVLEVGSLQGTPPTCEARDHIR